MNMAVQAQTQSTQYIHGKADVLSQAILMQEGNPFADTVESLTPQKMRGIRVILNASAMDVLYYTSPLYRSEVPTKTISLRIKLKSSIGFFQPFFHISFCLIMSQHVYIMFLLQITHSLELELNNMYNMFCERHPYFEANGGKVSIVAHSLGNCHFCHVWLHINHKFLKLNNVQLELWLLPFNVRL